MPMHAEKWCIKGLSIFLFANTLCWHTNWETAQAIMYVLLF